MRKTFIYIIIFLTLIISSSQLYYSYKFSDPNYGNSDFFQYAGMVEDPFVSESAESPFIYRQFTTLIANFIYSNDIFYDTEISFKTDRETQKIFFALLISNYLGILFCFFTLIYFIKKYLNEKSIIFYFFPVFLVLTSFGYVFNGLAPLTEGWTYFFNLIAFIMLIEKKLTYFLIFIVLSILNKEIKSIIFCIFSFALIIYQLKTKKSFENFYIKTFIISLLCFITYIIIRVAIFPIDGGEAQINIKSLIHNLIKVNIDITLIKQGILSITTLIILLFFILINNRYYDLIKDKMTFSLIISIFILFIVGLMSGIGNNIGRIISSMTPIIVLISLKYIDSKYEKNLPF